MTPLQFSYRRQQQQQQQGSTKSVSVRPWRQLKQIVAVEQALPWPEDAVRFSSIDAPPSFRPTKRYSDLSGLEAPYTDPQVTSQCCILLCTQVTVLNCFFFFSSRPTSATRARQSSPPSARCPATSCRVTSPSGRPTRSCSDVEVRST